MSLIDNEPILDTGPYTGPRRKPWFYSSNRKLRHLQGVLVRNLVVVHSAPSRAGRKTIDDDNALNALQTPAKALAVQEARSMHHSRSATDLRLDQMPPSFKTSGSQHEGERKKDVQSKRRRSTLPWAGASPVIRQGRLEDITGNKMADTFISLHCPGIDEPVYVSEVVEKAMNPTFRSFDLNACGPAVSRSGQVIFKLWTKTEKMSDYTLLLELNVNLGSLQYIGKALDQFHQPLPSNCVVFSFPDGIYTNLTDMPPAEPAPAMSKVPAPGAHFTSSYDALMRLANLDDCIQDALATREKLESQINEILEKNRTNLETINRTSQAQERLSSVKRAVLTTRKQLRQSVKRKSDIIASLKARRDGMAAGRLAQERTQDCLSDAQSTMSSSERLLHTNTEGIMGQIRRICEDMQKIYPIEPIPRKPLAFTIANLPLPNSSFEDINKESVAAALGYTAQLVYLLSFYLSVPLPYPVKPYLSNSYIQDPISVGLAQRTHPLYMVNTQYRFEYGVFLLNKDIEYLMNRMGLRVLDIRHTLPNLKYLLYFLTAGTGELPARKAGGVRGLLGDGITSSLSRRGSEDSTMSGADAVGLRRMQENYLKANGHAVEPPGGKARVQPIPVAGRGVGSDVLPIR
ncbi:hypothetical protein AJ80_00669 [Polytolypa hystricis UAMH7299]|uniref:Autophagy-related protein 14 n=1 Tax=Polytolypa hystricis (strain UAMH7299) TaxID=1447883 RepID=A0A2B7Z218_POLH7|nr:hypothetical protein AJ80_00669 [Polytolypa hystricis UAMH7299]